jgi:hypothetical protein
MQSEPAAPARLPRVQQQSLLHTLVPQFAADDARKGAGFTKSQAAFGSALSGMSNVAVVSFSDVAA